VALLRSSAVDNNRRWMRDFLEKTGTKLAPHGKTYMSPEIFRWQLEDGAWGITLATVQQVRVARAAGVDRILLANEIVSARDMDYILRELRENPSFEFFCLVDSVAGVERLVQAAKMVSAGRPLKLLVEVGYSGGRTGCRDLETTLNVARIIKGAEPLLTLSGVEGFEGLHGYLSASEGVPKVQHFLARVVETAECLDQQGLFGTDEILLSAGGSAYYDLVEEAFSRSRLTRRTAVVLRSGCYFTHDAGWYERLFSEVLKRSTVARGIAGRFENALEVWAYVLSVPEEGRAILGAGRRDFGHDVSAPIPLKKFRPGKHGELGAPLPEYKIVGINDQHAHMTFPASAEVQVGDMIALGISHPCTTFDKWRLIHIVDDHYNVLSSVQTYF
jgi:D-serine dehydratase